MPDVEAALVDIVREFFAAHELMRRLLVRHREGALRFEELTELVGDDERSVLFRLKERCHALFRSGAGASRVAVRREELFDLAVGSLFHEAMSVRENFYQREVYGPKVRALQREREAEQEEEAGALFEEFEKILTTATTRLEDGLAEAEALLDQTREQLAILLREHRASGHLARYLIEHAELSSSVFGRGLEELLEEIHAGAAGGYERAGRSYLSSGYYGEAEGALEAAVSRGAARADMEPLIAYARGMRAYLLGDYGESVVQLGAWLEASASPPAEQGSLARAALLQLARFAEGEGRRDLSRSAARLAERLKGVAKGPALRRPPARAGAGTRTSCRRRAGRGRSRSTGAR